MSPSGLEILESTPNPEGGPAPVPHTNPCRLSARKWNVVTAKKKSLRLEVLCALLPLGKAYLNALIKLSN